VVYDTATLPTWLREANRDPAGPFPTATAIAARTRRDSNPDNQAQWLDWGSVESMTETVPLRHDGAILGPDHRPADGRPIHRPHTGPGDSGHRLKTPGDAGRGCL
jgi:hypothetical protein